MESRYFPPAYLMDQLKLMQLEEELEVLGKSVENREIYSLTLGTGSIKVLAWSQMHGNESTTTKACLDLIKHLKETQDGKALLKEIKVQIILQLNPDGAVRYTRLNANKVDLNRDAVSQSQPEMKVLQAAYSTLKPDLCLNLHGQRTIFSAGNSNKPAAMSFLAPSANASREVTPARQIAMQLIAKINSDSIKSDQWGIGRYDDSFNINCTGDFFTANGTPTLLFEAGHFPDDYNRIKTRALIYSALLSCLSALVTNDFKRFKIDDYDAIPNNGNHLRDIEINNVTIVNNGNVSTSSIFIQYKEELKQGEIKFVPEFVNINAGLTGLKVIDAENKNQTEPVNIVKSSIEIIKHLQSFIDF